MPFQRKTEEVIMSLRDGGKWPETMECGGVELE